MHRRFLVLAAAFTLVGGTSVLLSAPAQAAFNPSACNTGAAYDNSFSGTVTGNVIVPAGATCNLQGATIGGSIVVQPGGRLIVGGGTSIGGSVTASNPGTDTANPFGTGNEAFSVIMCNSRVTGSVSVSGAASQVLIGGTSTTGGQCGGNNIGGSVSLSNNHGPVTVAGNMPSPDCRAPGGTCGIGGSLSLTNNTPGPVTVRDNAVTGSISCSGNGTVSSGGNTSPSKTGQCAEPVYTG